MSKCRLWYCAPYYGGALGSGGDVSDICDVKSESSHMYMYTYLSYNDGYSRVFITPPFKKETDLFDMLKKNRKELMKKESHLGLKSRKHKNK